MAMEMLHFCRYYFNDDSEGLIQSIAAANLSLWQQVVLAMASSESSSVVKSKMSQYKSI